MITRIAAETRLSQLHERFLGNTNTSDGFLGGTLGLLFYYYHLADVTGDTSYSALAEEMLAGVFDKINEGEDIIASSTFSSGLAGFTFAVSFLQKEGYLDIDIHTELSELDELLFNVATEQIEQDCIDYLHGAFGIIHYFSQRTPNAQTCYYLDALIEQACNRRVQENNTCWFRNCSLRTANKNAAEINFSLSHGLTGILLILLNAYEVSAHKTLIREVLESGIRFIQQHQLQQQPEKYTVFPFAFNNGQRAQAYPNRMAWCYGDLNEVLLLNRAGRLLGDATLVNLAKEVGYQSTLRKTADATMITDSHFCHGASGIAQFYKVLYDETGAAFYQDAYQYWITQTMELLDKDLAAGAYSTNPNDYLEGLVGVAFTLLSYTTDKKLNWSKSLLL